MAVIIGTSESDSLVGTGADDQIDGLGGDDFLNGGGGKDIFNGGGGNDTFVVDSADDQVIESVNDGNDAVYAISSYALAAGVEVEILSAFGQAGAGALNLTGNGFAQTLIGNAGNNLLNGGGGADVLYGLGGNDTFVVDVAADQVIENVGGGSDVVYALASYALAAAAEVEVLSVFDRSATAAVSLIGNAFSQTLIGNAGDNSLNGGGGADVLYGLGGNDSYVVDGVEDLVVENAGQGVDTVFASGSYALAAAAEVEVLSVFDRSATAAVSLSGNAFSQTLIGNAGDNSLNGGGGADVLYGLGGNDSYVVDGIEDLVVENAGQGVDTVFALSSYALAASAEVEVLSVFDRGATAAVTLSGNAFSQTLIGNAGDNSLNGGGGADVLYGLGGNDSYIVDGIEDLVVENAGQGVDTVFALSSYALAAAAEVEVVSAFDRGATAAVSLSGNAFSQTLIGNAGDNSLNGGGGADVLYGLGGNDSYIVDGIEDLVVENAGQGVDTVFALSSYALAAASEVEVLSVFDRGATAAVSLSGNAFSQTLIGNAGDNLLDGGGGADVLYGLGGADTYAFTTALGAGNVDTVAGFVSGTDRIQVAGANGQPFSALASGALAAGAFVIGTAALDANDYLIYNSGTGALLYDADGAGGGAAVQFALLGTGLALTAADFIVSGPANNAPVVTSAATATIAENSPVGTIVYQAEATDSDGDRITYTLGGADASAFTIDAAGAVRFVVSPDYEARASYSISVIASDSASSTTRAVTVSVTDVQEGGPSTPIIAETSAANGNVASAQIIDRNALVVADNGLLFDDALPSATIRGAISPSTDADFYAITLQAGERLVLDIDNTPSVDLDIVVRIYNSAGVQLGFNDDGAVDPGSDSNYPGATFDSFLSFRAPSAGTYYFSVESYGPPDTWNPEDDPPGQGQTSGTYDLNVSIGPAASAAELIEEDIQALISGQSWPDPNPGQPGTNLTYSFPDSVSDYPNNPASDTDGFSAFNASQQAATTQLLQLVANVASLTFTNITGPQDGSATLRYAENDQDGAAYAYYPGGNVGGTAWFNHSNFNTPTRGNYAWMGILHETGHALGLKHGHEIPAISYDRDSIEYTVMTYRSYPGDSVTGGYNNETWGYAQSLMMLDIAALQRIYGANFATQAGDSVYSWNNMTGQMSINGAGQGAPGGNRIFLTIWDGGGADTYNMDNYSNAVTIDLRPGEWSITSTIQLANLGSGHFARGNVANALLFEGDTRSLIENAVGGSGGDTIIANEASNLLTGNAGADRFVWKAGADGADIGGAADTITDFLRGTDKIDLAGVDARSGTPADDAFAFIDTAAFHGVAGELRYQVEGGNVRIQGDTDGNGLSDFEIVVSNQTIFAASDFSFL